MSLSLSEIAVLHCVASAPYAFTGSRIAYSASYLLSFDPKFEPRVALSVLQGLVQRGYVTRVGTHEYTRSAAGQQVLDAARAHLNRLNDQVRYDR